MSRTSLVLLAAVLVLGACGPKSANRAASEAARPAPDPAATPDFVQRAGVNDLFELEAAKIAEARSKNPEVQAFAQSAEDAYTQANAALKSAVAASGQSVTVPTALPPDYVDKLLVLKGADPADFDEAYMDGQISAHQEALALMQRYAQDGAAPELKSFAATTREGVQARLDTARKVEAGLN